MKKEQEDQGRLKLTVVCDPCLTDSISDYFVGILDAAVEIGVEDDLTEHTLQAFIAESASDEVISGIVEQVTDYLKELSSIFSTQVPKLEVSFFQDEDWSRNWKKYFRPFAIIPGLVIKPTWEDYTTEKDEKIIEMDPGMAFGTGHHATTSLCMGFIKRSLELWSGGTVLDVGTGTGILAMAAAIWGAEKVLGIDNDPVAVEAARQNVLLNKLDNTVEVEVTALEKINGSYSLVVANIIHDVLLQMKPDLCRLTAPDGLLVLSGILKEKQADNIIQQFEMDGMVLADRAERDEWSALCFRKKITQDH